MRRLVATFAVFGALFSPACTVNVSSSESVEIQRNQCSSDSDCGDGVCWSNAACVAHEGALSTLLLELTPPVTAPIMGGGGVRYLRIDTGLSRSNEQHDLDVQGVSTVHGFLKSSCQYDVTLTPEEQSFGLPAVSYVTHSVPATQTGPCAATMLSGAAQEFVVDVPSGTMDTPAVYDVYLRPSAGDSTAPSGDAGTGPACAELPQLLRGRISADPGTACVALGLGLQQALNVHIPWPATAQPLDGWKLDVLDPLSGQVLSQTPNAIRASNKDATDPGYTLSFKYSPAMSGDSKSGQELLRLSPPSVGDSPVVLFSLQAAIASSAIEAGAQTAELPAMGPFPTKVLVDGWVWEQSDGQTPVPSTVTFSATRLYGLPSGIFASFSTSVMVGKDGRLSVKLFPGEYRVRTVPAVDSNASRLLATGETTMSVRAPEDGAPPTVAGRGVLVPNGVNVTGQALSALGARIDRATVQVLPAAIGATKCADPDASTCESEPSGILEQSLAQEAFVPRNQTAVTSGDGTFVLENVDCGGCEQDPGRALFDLSVQPPDGSRIPWILRPGLSISTDTPVATLRGSLPIILRGTVQVPSKGNEPTPVPGTLIRAFLMRDATGAPVSNPAGMPSCSSGTYSGAAAPTRCIRSVLQVAATSADGDGKYELTVPSAIDSLAP